LVREWSDAANRWLQGFPDAVMFNGVCPGAARAQRGGGGRGRASARRGAPGMRRSVWSPAARSRPLPPRCGFARPPTATKPSDSAPGPTTRRGWCALPPVVTTWPPPRWPVRSRATVRCGRGTTSR
jgi:hypothetical protein